MDWHARFSQQANWTRNLREYLFGQTRLENAQRVLEVGCGTGAILTDIKSPSLHGLDIQPASLIEAQIHAPVAFLTRGDAHSLPYANASFDVTFCHFLLLWVSDPLQVLHEMKRVTKPGGHILALAEPDYLSRVDEPSELAELGRWQTKSLQRQGAEVGIGARLAESFYQAGITLVETGAMERSGKDSMNPDERELEWTVLEADLAGFVSRQDIQRMKALDETAWVCGKRVLYVPTYFAWGRV